MVTDSGQPTRATAQTTDLTFDDLHREFGDRWKISPITGGYRAITRDTGGHAPIPRYGRTPAEVAESIRIVESQP
jgi:hypothetical protein